MSYVIQNFYTRSRHSPLTPRFKFLLLLNNLEKFFTFFKFNASLYFLNKLNDYSFDYFFFFLKTFFSKQYLKLLYKTNLSLVGNYDNNLTKGSVFYIFNNIYRFLRNESLDLKLDLLSTEYLYNLYYYSIKILNTKINDQLYKNIFFNFMLVLSFL